MRTSRRNAHSRAAKAVRWRRGEKRPKAVVHAASAKQPAALGRRRPEKALVFHALPLRLSPPCRGGAAARFLCCSAAAADGSSGRGSSDGKARFSPLPPNQAFSETPTSAVSQESGKRKRGRPKRVPDVSVLSTPVPVADGTPILQTPPASSVHESVTKKRGRRSKLVQDISDTSTPPVHSKESEPFMQTPAVTVLEDGKRKRGRPKRVPDSSVTPSSHSVLTVDVDSGDTSKRGRPRKIDTSLLHLPSLFSDDPRESTDNILMMFDALRRRLMQLDEVKQVAKQQQNLKAGSIMMSAELRLSKNKRIGEVPGVEVGDMFYFRIEMCLVGLNSQSMAGIDYMSAKFGNEEDPVAISIVSAGVYEDAEDNDPDVLVYSGHGMSGKDDQKLEREDDYIFETPPSEQNLRWNYAPELLGEPSLSDLNESSKQLPIIISAKYTVQGFLWLNNQPLRDTFLVEEAAYGGGGIMGVVFQPHWALFVQRFGVKDGALFL
ncbi:hypothetical protein ZWY2020_007149 [Hordeum vulgare]|nr:hypothetical protein ZWY2020_007149 [Hordeum vulgare]